MANLSSSSEEEDNVSLSSLASVKKAAELWGGGANTWEGGTPATRETTPRATFKLTPAHPQWNLQAAGINPATGRPMMAGEDEEKSTAPTGATPKAPKQLPEITLEDWNDQREELERLKRELARISDPTGSRTVATQETKIPQYSGFTDDRSAEVWLQKAESVARQFGWSDDRFIEAATNCFTKSAEAWYLDEKFKRDNTRSTVLLDKDRFKEAFLKQFDVQKSISSQTRSLATLKQEKDENVSAYWVRVSNTLNELLVEYRDERGSKPDAEVVVEEAVAVCAETTPSKPNAAGELPCSREQRLPLTKTQNSASLL